MAAKIEYTGDEFSDKAKRVIVSQQLPFHKDPRTIFQMRVRPSRLAPYRDDRNKITQSGGWAWHIHRPGDRASALASIHHRGEAYVVSAHKHVDETRVHFGDALLLALDRAAVAARIRGY